MQMKFDEVKATQTAASFLRLSGGHMQYLALIKMLYMLDRTAIDRWGSPVTTDRHVSMKYGPVTSQIYNLMKARTEQQSPSFWSSYIRRDGYSARLVADPSDGELSPAEDALIAEIYQQSKSKDGFELAEDTHRLFNEWTDPGSSSKPIYIEDILRALEKDEDEIAHTESVISLQNCLSKMVRS